MLNFTIRLETPFGDADFIFNPIFIITGARYHVSVTGTSNKPIFFNMDLKDGVWHVLNAPKVPEWIMHLQNELAKAIIEHNAPD